MEIENINKRVLYEENGVAAYLTPAPNSKMSFAEIVQKDVPKDAQGNLVPHTIVEKSVIPTDREFREGWEYKGGAIVTSFIKAKDITKDRLRVERTPLLEEQDILFMKAQEAGTSTTDIVTEKNRLRDVTKLADSATTTDELKALGVSE